MPSTSLVELRELAWRACTDVNYGNDGNWNFSFVRAIEGIYTRRWGADRHYQVLTEWILGLRSRSHEYELASCLFCMDSAIECWAFALNALGFAVQPTMFASMKDVADLRRISPEAVFGEPKRRLPGFVQLYPSVTRLWEANATDIRLIMNNHDVSKHRSATFAGGTMRMDAPAAFLRSVPGLAGIELLTGAPMSKILLPLDPKLPMSQRPNDLAHWCDLKDIKKRFDILMNQTEMLALSDATANIALV